jgi:hypothetical protein
MYTSVPDIRELKDVSSHLSHLPHCGSFASHQFPRPEDNRRSVKSPDKSPPGVMPRKRPSSASPVRVRDTVARQLRAILDDSDRPRYRYLPDQQLEAAYLWLKQHHHAGH